MVELVIFVVMGLVALSGAIGVVRGRNPVYAAMGLMATLFALAVFYVVHLAHFVAAVQIIVYAGAVMTLFLFVIMFVGVDRAEKLDEKLPVQRPIALVVVVGAFVFGGFLAVSDNFVWTFAPDDVAPINGTVEEIGANLILTDSVTEPGVQDVSRWLLPFEATSALLIVASVGAVALAFYRPRRVEEGRSQEGRNDAEVAE
jgi:NADH-quinone oxidoreductase subunit J